MSKEIINVHCHILNFDFIPNAFFKVYSPIREWMLRSWITRILARFIKTVLPVRYAVDVLSLMRKDFRAVADELLEEMDKSGMVLATPLMMDLKFASFNKKPEIGYRHQVMAMSMIAAEHPGRLMPFVMFDPRRKAASQLINTALKEMGFLGVKMYPPLGYHPDPYLYYNDPEVNEELKKVYDYCQENSIPITVHCSKGGAYSGDLMRIRELVHHFTHPSSWIPVLEKYPALRLNFGHFGGCDDLLIIDEPESWTRQIVDLIVNSPYEHVYADISYHDKALNKKTSEKYFRILNGLLEDEKLKKRILFGTDWFMARYVWTEKKYVDTFRRLDEKLLETIALENPMRFLFPKRKFPDRILDFYKKHGTERADLPPWMKDYFGW